MKAGQMGIGVILSLVLLYSVGLSRTDASINSSIETRNLISISNSALQTMNFLPLATEVGGEESPIKATIIKIEEDIRERQKLERIKESIRGFIYIAAAVSVIVGVIVGLWKLNKIQKNNREENKLKGL